MSSKTKPKQPSLADEIRELLNRRSREANTNTPDYVLADYLVGCLCVFESATRARDEWHGVHPSPGHLELDNRQRKITITDVGE